MILWGFQEQQKDYRNKYTRMFENNGQYSIESRVGNVRSQNIDMEKTEMAIKRKKYVEQEIASYS